jgi:hypothetical protein
MKTKFDNIIWGLILVLAGGLALAQQQGWIETFSTQFWVLAFGAVGLIFLVRYLVAGVRFWGWLFPACIFLALAAIIWLTDSTLREAWMVTPLFGAIVIPFLVAFAVDFRKNWWALIPSFVMTILCMVVAFGETLPGEIVGASFMFAIAIPFAVVYLVNHKNWWALIPAFIMGISGIMVLLNGVTGLWAGAFFTIVIAVAFFFLYFKYPNNWWALLPAGILGSIGINALLTDPHLGKFAQSNFPAAVLFLGWAATFGWLWRQREKYPTAWARIPAMVASIVAFVLLAVGSLTEFGLVVILIAGGLLLIYFGLRPRKETTLNNKSE